MKSRTLVICSRALLLASAFFAVVAICGCTGVTAWITQATQIVPIAASMVTAVLSLIAALAGKTLSASEATSIASVVTAIQAGLGDIEKMVTAYQSAPSTTLLGQIEAGTQAVLGNINAFLTDVHVTDVATQAKIVAILTLVLNEVQSFASLLPVLKAGAGEQITITVPLSSKSAKEAFNAILDAPSGNPHVDAALAKLHRL